MRFSPNYKNRLKETQREQKKQQQQQLVQRCRDCGFTQIREQEIKINEKRQITQHENEEEKNQKQQQPTLPSSTSPLQEVKRVEPQTDKIAPKSTIKIVCPSYGYDKATWTMVQTDRADEPSTQSFQCAGCNHTHIHTHMEWRVAHSYNNFIN